ncbi:MAG: hypothetical protein HPY60_10710 [Candidatus Methanofastidiosum sp.]|nr:hypothetical protein [Methanofastidiosum sp.]
MELICGTKLIGKDLKIIKKAHQNPEKVIEDFYRDKKLTLLERFVNDNLNAL